MKKGMEILSSVPIPSSGLRIAPISRISNASQPTPSSINKPDNNHCPNKRAMMMQDIIHPRRRFSCITSVHRFKFAKFELTDSNVRKRPFPLAASPTNGFLGLRIPSMLNDPPCRARLA